MSKNKQLIYEKKIFRTKEKIKPISKYYKCIHANKIKQQKPIMENAYSSSVDRRQN